MLKILSISNFKTKISSALVLLLLGILVIELVGKVKFEKKYHTHEVDQTLYQLDSQQFNAKYLLLGDSVGRQLLSQYSGSPAFAFLATNQAVEMTGQLFITRRYLRKNSGLKGVVFVGLPFLDGNLEQNYTENFVYRTFTHLDEIWTIFTVKHDLAIALKMLTYKFFKTYKYRLKLQDKIIDFTNADIYSNVDAASKTSDIENHSIFRVIRSEIPQKNSSVIHFLDLLQLLEDRGIDFFYIPAPMEQNSPVKAQHLKLVSELLPPIRKRFPRFHYISELTQHHKTFFRDHIHYTDDALHQGQKNVRVNIDRVLGL